MNDSLFLPIGRGLYFKNGDKLEINPANINEVKEFSPLLVGADFREVMMPSVYFNGANRKEFDAEVKKKLIL
ncbi:MAG: hypothetical protein Q8N88_01375 [Nanoarchaeota archaeon]|nr:hypothetical protein [Nanoarchaeota archaeon]